MKAIIPVAGAGTKLRPLTYTQPKPLIPVAGKPIISFIIDQLYEVGIDDFIFIIGYLGEKIKNYVEFHYPQIKKEFVVQNSREGSGHAIWTAKQHFLQEDEVFIFFGDTIIDIDFGKIIQSPSSSLGIAAVTDPWEYGVVETGDQGVVKHLVEKPKIPKSNLAMVGFYKINEVRDLVRALDYIVTNNRRTYGEYQLTDALMHMISNGIQIDTIKVNNWYNCGKYEVLLETNALLLDRGKFAIPDTSKYKNAIIIPPVSIGENCSIENSIVGPHVTIGNYAQLDSTILKNSIIGNYASIKEAVLLNSIIGNDTSIKGFRQSLNIGDNTEIDFS